MQVFDRVSHRQRARRPVDRPECWGGALDRGGCLTCKLIESHPVKRIYGHCMTKYGAPYKLTAPRLHRIVYIAKTSIACPHRTCPTQGGGDDHDATRPSTTCFSMPASGPGGPAVLLPPESSVSASLPRREPAFDGGAVASSSLGAWTPSAFPTPRRPWTPVTVSEGRE